MAFRYDNDKENFTNKWQFPWHEI